MGSGIPDNIKPWRACGSGIEQPPAHLPQCGEEPLIGRSLEILCAERSAGAGGHRSDDALDELNMFEPPFGEALLVFEKRFGEKEQDVRSGAGVQLVESQVVVLDDSEKEGLQSGA